MKSRPQIFDAVLVVGGGSPSTDGPAVARIGGWWGQPNLGLSYLLAARHVLEAGERERRVNEVALPAAYLQRHALEVAIKDVLQTALRLERDTGWLEMLKRDPTAKAGEPAACPKTHDFATLLETLRGTLNALGFGHVPDEIVSMTKRLGAAERFDPTRLRYLTLRNGEQSFPEAVLLEVGDTQEQLEVMFERVFHYQGFEVETQNLVTSLAYEAMAVEQGIQRIVPLDELY